jgi:hypothetical protein
LGLDSDTHVEVKDSEEEESGAAEEPQEGEGEKAEDPFWGPAARVCWASRGW